MTDKTEAKGSNQEDSEDAVSSSHKDTENVSKMNEKGLKSDDNLESPLVSQESGTSAQPSGKQSDEKSTKPSKSPKPKKKSHHKLAAKGRFLWAATASLLLIVVLGAANYWQYQQGLTLKQSQQQFGQQLSDSSQQITQINSQISDTSNQQKNLAIKTQQNEAGQQAILESLDQMSQQLKALATAKGKEPLFWKVSEVEYLLSVANYRLILENDLSTARVALRDADKRLRFIGDPGLIPIRKQVAQEISALEKVSLPDISGMVAQLNTLSSNLGEMPFVKNSSSLASGESDPNTSESGVSSSGVPEEGKRKFTDGLSFVRQVWSDIVNGLFTIQRIDEPIEPLLPPEEKHYLKHNLGLKLEQARIALLKLETKLFQSNLEAIEQWVKEYFERDNQAVSNLLQVTAELQQVELQPKLPDISASLRELRAWMEIQKQVATLSPNSSKSLRLKSKLPDTSVAKLRHGNPEGAKDLSVKAP